VRGAWRADESSDAGGGAFDPRAAFDPEDRPALGVSPDRSGLAGSAGGRRVGPSSAFRRPDLLVDQVLEQLLLPDTGLGSMSPLEIRRSSSSRVTPPDMIDLPSSPDQPA